MPIKFDLESFTNVSNVFCETGTYIGNGVIAALDAGFTNIASIEISDVNLNSARERIKQHSLYGEATVELIEGDAAEKIDSLIDFALNKKSKNPVFFLDAHTHTFADGTRTQGTPCPLKEEISAINLAFHGDAVLLIDDLRIIGSNIKTPEGKRARMRAAMNALFRPTELSRQLRPIWGKDVNLLSLMRLASEAGDVSMCFLEGIEPADVLCVYPKKLHLKLFQ